MTLEVKPDSTPIAAINPNTTFKEEISGNGIIRVTRADAAEIAESHVKTRTTLLTGATGALGQELMCQFLQNRPAREKLVILARGKSKSGDKAVAAQRRVRTLLKHHFSDEDLETVSERVSVVDGDVTESRLGLDAATFAELASQVDSVLHCAAAVRFDQPIEEARQVNLEGTRQALELARQARRCGLEGRFDYVSTAYIAGKRQGVVSETELEHTRGFHNTYEQSKYEAEQLVRQYKDEIPVTVLRPSIIVGDSRTGETTSFKAFYWPIRVYATGQMRVLPGRKSSHIDLVPVDYVAAATLYLTSLSETIGGCYHVTAGRDNTVTLREIIEATIDFFQVTPPPVINPTFLKLLEGRIGRRLLGEHIHKTLMLGKPYYPYLALKLEFDTSEADKFLKPANITAPRLTDFFNRLFSFCVESNWGKKTAN